MKIKAGWWSHLRTCRCGNLKTFCAQLQTTFRLNDFDVTSFFKFFYNATRMSAIGNESVRLTQERNTKIVNKK